MECNTERWNDQVNNYDINIQEIQKEINNYKQTSEGPDGITISFLKNTIKWSSYLLCKIINMSLKEGKVPIQLKNANVTPLLKDPKKNRHTFKNYRPISVTSIVSRILEKIIRSRIHDQIMEKIPMYQYGSRDKTSTVDALVHVWTDISKNSTMYTETNVVFLDISKAFDRLIRELIIWKLKYVCNISDPIVKWIFEFLTNRKQRVKVWGNVSNWMNTVSGAPQGSVLVPLLFVLYLCDIPVDVLPEDKSRSAKFVDDICLYSTGDVHEQIKDINERLKRIFEWSNKWGVDFNVDKCKSMTFSNEVPKMEKYDRTLFIGGKVIKKVDSYKYLGLTFHKNLKFDSHVDEIIKKCKKSSGMLSQVCKKTKIGNRLFSKLFWKIKIRPLIEYGAVIWTSSLSKNKFKSIQQLQAEFCRKTHNYGSTACISAMLMDMSIVEIGLRVGSIVEKYLIKSDLERSPTRINLLCKLKDQIPTYNKKLTRDDQFPNGYIHVKEHNGRMKYRSSVKFHDGRNPKHFYSNYARDVALQRIKWINKNIRSWYSHRFTGGNVFKIEKFIKEVKSVKLIQRREIDDWINVLEGDKDRLWKCVKRTLKVRVKMRQEFNWNSGNVGTILKQFKTTWYDDKIINIILNDKVYLLKRLRIGNSKLRRHCKRGDLKICINCDDNKIEDIEHYLLHCKKFDGQRELMLQKVRNNADDMGIEITTKILLGFFETQFKSKGQMKKFHKNIYNVVDAVINYIVQTGRFV